MSKNDAGQPFIVRSEVAEASASDQTRRKTLISTLSDADLDRVAGGTNWTPDYAGRDWDPEAGGDGHTTKDAS